MQMTSLAKEAVPAAKKRNRSKTIAQSAGLDALQLLESQHREVDELFHQIETASDRATRDKEALLREIEAKLTLHARLEEKVFYPSIKALDGDFFHEALEEHETVKFSLERARGTAAKAKDFKAKITVLKELVQHHVKEEETELFPKVRREMSRDEFVQLSARLQRALERELEPIDLAARRAPAKRAAQTRRKAAKKTKVTAKPRAKVTKRPKARAATRAKAKKTSR